MSHSFRSATEWDPSPGIFPTQLEISSPVGSDETDKLYFTTLNALGNGSLQSSPQSSYPQTNLLHKLNLLNSS